MADRLQELLQQRALIKEHLAWLEGEISAASGLPREEPTSSSVQPLPPSGRPTVNRPFSIPVSSPVLLPTPKSEHAPTRVRDETDAMIARLAAEENSAPVPTKKGCWIFFWLTLAVLGVVAWAVIHYFYRE